MAANAPRRIVITGSTRGIGRGLARELLRRGHDVAISGRDAGAVEAAIRDLRSEASAAPGRIAGAACDVSDAAALQRLWDAAQAAFGGVDIWINNAGLSHPRQRAGEMRAEHVNSVQETNLLGMMLATQVAMRGMQAQPDGGLIYNMEGFGSNGMTTPGMSLYGASKFALTYFNKALLAETRDSRVRVCWLSPGIVVTDLLKRDMGSASADWERTKRVYNILADRVETVTPFLAEGVLANDKAGARIAWLTSRKAAGRFLMSLFRKRTVLTDADFAR
jgi:NAD(P)-dependent dehydrogenase (short-subunit alcohol dehydrogenase family)